MKTYMNEDTDDPRKKKNVFAHEHQKWRNAMNKPYYESLHDTHTVTTDRFFFA